MVKKKTLKSSPAKSSTRSTLKKPKNLKQILSQETSNEYQSLESPPSLIPKVKYSDLTGLKAKYVDPHTRLQYASHEEYQFIKQLTPAQVDSILEMRRANVVLNAQGNFRVEATETDSICQLIAKLPVDVQKNCLLSNQPNGSRPFSMDSTLRQCQIKHGDLIFASSSAQTSSSIAVPTVKIVYMNPVDVELEIDPGLITRKRDGNFCRHGANAMCDYCMPVEPYDANYLKEANIKHLSYYSYLKQRKIQDKATRVLLEEPNFCVLEKCPSGHAPYPKSMCAKCQPSAIVLQQQAFRMVDHVEFDSPAMVDNFISNWRRTGLQRFGFLYGTIKRHKEVPLGIKIVVHAIFEPPQIPAVDGVELLNMDESGKDNLDFITSKLGLEKLGMIYTDLIDDASGTGKVVCKRHVDSYFLSSSECVFIARKQLENPFKTEKSTTGTFGSRFVTVVVSGDIEGNIQLSAYQVSNTCMGMIRDEIVDATTDPHLMRMRQSSPDKYIPDVFYKYKNQYGVLVQEAAKPTFPVDYFIATVTEGFPQISDAFFANEAFVTENYNDMSQVKTYMAKNNGKDQETVSNFHFLLFLASSNILSRNELETLLDCIKHNDVKRLNDFLLSNDSWKTLKTLVMESHGRSEISNKSEWTCRHCTLINAGSRNECEMCGLPKD